MVVICLLFLIDVSNFESLLLIKSLGNKLKTIQIENNPNYLDLIDFFNIFPFLSFIAVIAY